MVAFQNDGGIWNAYGTQQVLGQVNYKGLDEYFGSTNYNVNDPHCHSTELHLKPNQFLRMLYCLKLGLRRFVNVVMCVTLFPAIIKC